VVSSIVFLMAIWLTVEGLLSINTPLAQEEEPATAAA
jgi:hypothetical protein